MRVSEPERTRGLPALFFLAALFLLDNHLVSEPLLVWLDVGVILAGAAAFCVWRFVAKRAAPVA